MYYFFTDWCNQNTVFLPQTWQNEAKQRWNWSKSCKKKLINKHIKKRSDEHMVSIARNWRCTVHSSVNQKLTDHQTAVMEPEKLPRSSAAQTLTERILTMWVLSESDWGEVSVSPGPATYRTLGFSLDAMVSLYQSWSFGGREMRVGESGRRS